MSQHRQPHGLTLIELLVTIGVLALLARLAAPGVEGAIGSGRLNAAAGEVAAALQMARSEAVRMRQRVVVCRSADQAGCNGNGDWTGWIAFVDGNGDGQRNAAESVLRAGVLQPPLRLVASASVVTLNHRITFQPDGLARNAAGLLAGTLAACIPTTRPPQNVRLVQLAFGGRTVVRRDNGGGACATPPDQ